MRARIYFTCGYPLPGPCCPTCRPHRIRCARAIRVTWALAAGNPPAAALPWRRRAAGLHPADRSVAEFGVKPPDEHRREQPDLSRPGGRVGGHRELAVGEAVGAGMPRPALADDVPPAADHRAHRRLLLPAPRVEQAADGAEQRLRIFP